jgi:hypothetical protein
MSNDFWSIFLLLGLAGWITSSIMLMFRVFPEKDVFNASSGMRWGGCVIVSFVVWVVGMLNA